MSRTRWPTSTSGKSHMEIAMKRTALLQETIETYGSKNAVVAAALAILADDMTANANRTVVNSPLAVRDYLRLTLAGLEYETFWMLSLDCQNRVIAAREMFRGTLSQTSVYPREVIKQALVDNAGGVIFAHNHPSGIAEPSRADELLTQALKQALSLVDVRVLDHFIIGAGGAIMSFAERGIL